MRKQHVITLTPAQRDALRRLVRRDATTALEQRRARWSLRLLAARVVELEIVPGICAETVRTTLKKSGCSPGARSAG